MAEKYDVIVIGGGHNGLTTAAYLAKGGEKEGKERSSRSWCSSATRRSAARRCPRRSIPASPIRPALTFCSLLRPEIFRFLDLPRHGLQVIPYEINSSPNPEGEGIITYKDHDRTRGKACAGIRSRMPRL